MSSPGYASWEPVPPAPSELARTGILRLKHLLNDAGGHAWLNLKSNRGLTSWSLVSATLGARERHQETFALEWVINVVVQLTMTAWLALEAGLLKRLVPGLWRLDCGRPCRADEHGQDWRTAETTVRSGEMLNLF